MNKKLDDETATFLTKLANTRRVKRKVDPKYGVEGEFYVDGKGFKGQEDDETVIDGNSPPKTQPGLWCQWIPSDDHQGLEWDGGEKFYESDKWMEYIINRILAPKGYVVNGTIQAQGEEMDDRWELIVRNNNVHVEYLNDKIEKAKAFDILIADKDDLPLFINEIEEEGLAKRIYSARLDGSLKQTKIPKKVIYG